MVKDKTIITVTAISAITALEILALSKGIDGTILAAVIASIAGLGGYKIRVLSEKMVKK